MIVFIIPLKSKQVSTSWSELSLLFERCLRSVCNQTSSEFKVIVVCNEKPDISFAHPQVEYLQVDFPVPENTYNAKVDDRAKRVVAGLLSVKDLQPNHVMSVDADDCISNRIAAFVNQYPDSNGWYVDSGYEYEEGSTRITIKRNGLYKICGTCNIFNYRVLKLPEKLQPYEQMSGYDRFISGHPVAKGDLAARGTPIEPLPFPGVVVVRDKAGESISMQESFRAKLKREPREAFRGIKKTLLAPFNQKLLTDKICSEFGLYNLF